MGAAGNGRNGNGRQRAQNFRIYPTRGSGRVKRAGFHFVAQTGM